MKNLIFYLSIGILLSGLAIAFSITVYDKKEISKQISKKLFHVPESYHASAVPKGTILLLLAVGLIGVLGISRKKKESGNPAQRNEIDRESENHNLNEGKKNP